MRKKHCSIDKYGIRFSRADSQFYGRLYEQVLTCMINDVDIESNKDVCTTKQLYYRDRQKQFTDTELTTINDFATRAKALINRTYDDILSARWCGDAVKHANGDVLLHHIDGNDTYLEVKFTNGSNGTYLNTSIDAVANRYGYMTFTKHMSDCDYYSQLSKIIGDKYVRYGQASPVTHYDSHTIRHLPEYDDDIKRRIDEIELPMRQSWIKGFYSYLCKSGQLERFIQDVISKDIIGKSIPDAILVTKQPYWRFIHIRQEEHYRKILC